MSSIDEKSGATTNVLTITRPTVSRQTSHQAANILSTIEDIDSTHSMTPPATPHEKTRDLASSPYSTFEDDRLAAHDMKSESKRNNNMHHSMSYDTDVEALAPASTMHSQSKSALIKCKTKSCGESAWPSPQQLMQRKKAAKREKMKCFGFWVDMKKRYKMLLLGVILLAIAGLGVGLGVGISNKVGGGAYSGGSPNAHIGN